MDVLARIKRLVRRGQYRLTAKAQLEMARDDLLPSEVLESILNARSMSKTVRSSNPRHAGEKLYIIKAFSSRGTFIYTKGAIRADAQREVFYVLVSAKLAAGGA